MRTLRSRYLLIFLLLLASFIGMIGLMFQVAAGNRATAVTVDVAGRNRMLSQRIALLVDQYAHEPNTDTQLELERALQRFDHSFYTLRDGGRLDAVATSEPIDPSSAAMRILFDATEPDWIRYREHVLAVLDETASAEDRDQAQREALEDALIVLSRTQTIVDGFVQENSVQQGTYRQVFLLFGLFNFFVLGVWFILSFQDIRQVLRLNAFVQQDTDRQEHDLALLTVNRVDEIGQLYQGVRQLLVRVFGESAELQEVVEEKTQALSEQVQEMQKVKSAMLNVLEDVDEEKAKFEGSFDAAAVGIALVAPDGSWIEVNEALPEIVGYTKEELLGRRFQDITHADDLEEDLGLLNEVMDGKRDRYQVQKRYIHKKGYAVWVLLSVSCVRNPDGTVKYFISQILDITKQKEVDKAKTEFVSLASHQLRTPLTAINWYAEMLLEGDAGNLNETQLEYVREMYKGNQRMVDLVNALLNVSRIELGTFLVDPRPTNLSILAEDILKELDPQIKAKKQRVAREVEDGFPEVMVDPKLIGIVIQNFLSNAVKYTPEGGSITFRLKQVKNNMRIEVQDTGMGIPEDQKPKIFSKLFRADNVRQVDADGTGLGLYIIKSIAESSKGRVWFESIENTGSTFFFEIPMTGMMARAGSKPLEPAKMPSPGADSKTT